MESYDYLIGLTPQEANDLFERKALNMSVRVTMEDGKNYMVTMDLRFDRINVHVENGVISKVEGIG
jgi:hypothetical protein